MQRASSIVVGVLSAGVCILAVLLSANGFRGQAHAGLDAGEAADALDASPADALVRIDASPAGPVLPGDAPATDGSVAVAAPELGEKARQVRFGVVLVAYVGAQGAPENARPKKDAEAIANKLAGDAKSDFHAAVLRGDNGSTDDVGRMPRGVLDAQTEAVVFTLSVGAVSDAIDTPRGFWIVKRLE